MKFQRGDDTIPSNTSSYLKIMRFQRQDLRGVCQSRSGVILEERRTHVGGPSASLSTTSTISGFSHALEGVRPRPSGRASGCPRTDLTSGYPGGAVYTRYWGLVQTHLVDRSGWALISFDSRTPFLLSHLLRPESSRLWRVLWMVEVGTRTSNRLQH